ncbi:hypothetical protein KBA27_00315 [bacterium]|nr:hypothetical protein [bacterium]
MKRFYVLILMILICCQTIVLADETQDLGTEDALQKAISAKYSAPKKSIMKRFGTSVKRTVFPDSGQNKKKATVSSEEIMTPHKEAILYYNDNNLDKALETILRMSENEKTAQDWFLLGNILQDKERNSDAVFMYKRAIAIDETFYKPYYNLGTMYLEDEKPYIAIENFKKAIHLKSDFAYSYYNMGCAYLQIGNLKKAKLAFIKAIEIKNTEPDFHYNLAYTYKSLNKPKLAKQYIDNYNKLLETPQN